MNILMRAILEINPDAVTIAEIPQGEILSYENIQWLEDTPVIPKDEVLAKANEIKKRDAHIQPRQDAYPSIQHQLDDIFHNGIDGWKETIQAVKDKYPKE